MYISVYIYILYIYIYTIYIYIYIYILYMYIYIRIWKCWIVSAREFQRYSWYVIVCPCRICFDIEIQHPYRQTLNDITISNKFGWFVWLKCHRVLSYQYFCGLLLIVTFSAKFQIISLLAGFKWFRKHKCQEKDHRLTQNYWRLPHMPRARFEPRRL